MTPDTRNQTSEIRKSSGLRPPEAGSRGYTLIELMVAVGLFAVIMLLAAGAYLVMIGINERTQSIATGIDTLSSALESMTRTIRTGTNYSCNGGGDCAGGGTSFSVRDVNGVVTTYALSGGAITKGGVALTDPSVTVSSLTFYTVGTPRGDGAQPRVTIIIYGTIPSGHGNTESFSIETGASMRGTDI